MDVKDFDRLKGFMEKTDFMREGRNRKLLFDIVGRENSISIYLDIGRERAVHVRGINNTEVQHGSAAIKAPYFLVFSESTLKIAFELSGHGKELLDALEIADCPEGADMITFNVHEFSLGKTLLLKRITLNGVYYRFQGKLSGLGEMAGKLPPGVRLGDVSFPGDQAKGIDMLGIGVLGDKTVLYTKKEFGPFSNETIEEFLGTKDYLGSMGFDFGESYYSIKIMKALKELLGSQSISVYFKLDFIGQANPPRKRALEIYIS